MAVGINSVWECRQTATAANVNGCGFNPENANMMTDLQTTGSSGQSSTPTVSSATYTFVSNDIDSYVFIKAGTSWTPGWYKITAVNTGVATLDAASGHVVKYTSGAARTFNISTVAGVGTSGALTGGTFSVDYSQQDTAEFSAADLASTIGTTNPATVTSSGKPFGRNMVGNFIHVTVGTSWTTGIYEIVSVSGTTATLDRACGSVATLSSGTFNTGGAASLCSAAGFTDDTFFELGASTAGSGSHVFFIKFGTYTTLGSIAIGAAGTAQNPIIIRGYNTYRTDTPTGLNRPTLNGGTTNSITLGSHWWMRDIYYTTGTSTGLVVGAGGVLINVKVLNNSTSADRPAINPAASVLIGCEAISYRGRAVGIAAGTHLFGCVFRNSDICIYVPGGVVTFASISHCIIEGAVTAALKLNAVISSGCLSITNCTFYGVENTAIGSASGLVLPAGAGALRVISNIFYGFVLGISVVGGDNVPGVYLDYNTFYNNGGSGTGTNVIPGPNDQAINPSFTNMGFVNGTTGAFVAGNGKLVDTSKNFTNLGVVAGDAVYIIFGAGSTIGYYGISSISTTTNPNDTLNLDINPGTNTTADKQYFIVVGHNTLPTGLI